MARLHVISDTLHGNTFDLSADYITIGRAADNTICLDHISVSKHHATLTIEGSDFKWCDLHSTNGTIVNGDSIVSTHLQDGDRITLGDVELRFALAEKVHPLSPPPIVLSTPISPVLPPTVAQVLSKPKSNGDSHQPDKNSPRRLPALARLKEFATKSSQMFSQLRVHRRPSQVSSPPDENRNDAVVPTAKAKAIPLLIEPTVIKPPTLDPPVKPAPERVISVSSPTVPSFFATPGSLAGEGKKEPVLILKPPAPVVPIEIKKPLPSPQNEPPSAAGQSPVPPQPVLPTNQPPSTAPRKVAGASIYVGMTSVGLLLLVIGYAGESNPLKFLGLVALITGFLSLFALLRNGSIIAPPKRRP